MSDTAVVEISSQLKYRHKAVTGYSRVCTVGSHMEKEREQEEERR